MQLSCPSCGGRDAETSQAPGLLGSIKALFGIYELRCRRCKSRWETSVWEAGDWKYARCPRCYRQNLTTWSIQDYRLGWGTRALIRLGATRYRCAPCRCNFASFRPPKDQLAWEQRMARIRKEPAEEQAQAEAPEVLRAAVEAPAMKAGLSAPQMKTVRNAAVSRTNPQEKTKPEEKPAPKPVPKPEEVTPAPKIVPVPVPVEAKAIEAKPVPVAAAIPTVEARPSRTDAEILASLRTAATIGRTVVIKGRILSGEDLAIDGEVEGAVEIPGHCLRVDANGKLRAKVIAHDVVLLGAIQGDVEASDRLDIGKDASLIGDIKAHRLVIEQGARVKGQVVAGASSSPNSNPVKGAGKAATSATKAATGD